MENFRYQIAGGCKAELNSLADKADPSLKSRLINSVLRLLPIKQKTASVAAVQAQVQKLALNPASYKPTGLGRNIEVIERQIMGWPVYYTAPSENPTTGNYVVFLHGGGYINEIVRAHWRFIGFLTRKARIRCIVPIYPLAPYKTAKDIVPLTGKLLHKVLEEAGDAKITVIGNSAGAGLALAAVTWLRDAGFQQPSELILVSPSIDASIDRPEHQAIVANDPIQDIPGIIEGARLYAGDLDIAHPYVSPLQANLYDLAPMVIFSGTSDLLYPDSIELTAKARAAGVAVELYLHKGQPHNYVSMPTPEGRQAREIILRTIAKDLK